MFETSLIELRAVAAAIGEPGGEPGDGPGRDEFNEMVAGLTELAGVLEATTATVLAGWDTSLAWTDDGSSSGTAWLKRNTGVRGATAAVSLKLARFLAAHRPVRALVMRGDITIDHAKLLARLKQPRVAERFEADLGLLCQFAVDVNADEFASICQQWLALADQDNGDDSDNTRRRHQKRCLYVSQLFDGTWKLDAILEPDSGAMLAGLLEQLDASNRELERRAVNIDPSLVFDATATQRRADAFAELIRRAFGVDLNSTSGPGTSIDVIIDDDMLVNGPGFTATGMFLPAETINKLCCGSDFRAIVMNGAGTELNMGRTIRLANRAQRRALAARDRHCRFPGCDRPLGWTVAHHIIGWDSNGPTDIDNLVLLCHHHHHLVHEGGWTLTRTSDGDFEFTSPDHRTIHPSQRTKRRARRRSDEHLGTRHARQDIARARARAHALANEINRR